MDYYDVHILVNDLSYVEILEAELAELPFESFQSEGVSLHAYIQTQLLNQDAVKEVVKAYADQIASHTISLITHQNWNETWEKSYDPVLIGDEIIIKAPFHKSTPSRKFEITLDPNMSFGTGHHPTTYMMLEELSSLELKNKSICDFGCGSGILAIYASLNEASGIGIEIDPHASEAAKTNFQINGCESFEIRTGGIEQLASSKMTFDVILANINKNIIEECIDTFKKHLVQNGHLICAGFLDKDAQDLINMLGLNGFQIQNRRSREGWTMLSTKKTI